MQVFYSKKDWWVVAFVICMSGLLIQLLLTMHSRGTDQMYPVHTAVYSLVVLLLWWPIFNTRYKIDDDYLTVKCLFLSWKIKKQDIEKISLTSNSIASPALSLDRLKIEYTVNNQRKFLLVSPRNQAKFCAALNQELG